MATRVLALVFGSALLSFLLTPVAMHLGHRWRLMDQPTGGLKRHEVPTPRSGGIAILATLLIASAIAHYLDIALLSWRELAPAVVLFAIGVWDDRRPRSAGVRLVLQIGAFVLAWVLAVRPVTPWPEWGAAIAALIWFVVVINGVNFYDGMDGLLPLTAACALGVFGLSVLGTPAGGAAALMGAAAVIGFLPRNWYPARVFLGDGGSFLIGYLFYLAACHATDAGMGVTAGLWIAAVPVTDAGAATLDRIFRGRSVWSGDRDHIYDILDRRGWSCPAIAVFLGAIAGGCAVVPRLMVSADRSARWIAVTLLYVVFTGVVWGMRVKFRAKQPG